MFLVRINNELQVAMFNRQLPDLIDQYWAINVRGDLMDDQPLAMEKRSLT